MEEIVKFENVSVSNNERSLVSHLSFAALKGETLVLLGRSGSGKTTTLKLINRLLLPTEGAVLVDGKSTGEWDPIQLRRRIGYCIQETGLFPHFTVEENVGVVPRLLGRPDARIQKRVTELLQLIGLAPDTYRSRYPSELSGGERQRVGVVRALAADPSIVLMDEPFGALDPITRTELQREFSILVRKLGKTIIFVTHDLREAFFLASRIAFFKEGRLLDVLRTSDLPRSENPEIKAFLQTIEEPAIAR